MRKRMQTKPMKSGPGRQNRWREDEARRVLGEWKRSGLSAESFARVRGVSPTRLSYWSKRLSNANANANAGDEVKFVPVSLRASSDMPEARGKIEIIRDGVTVRVREDLDAEHVARLVSALARMGSRC